MKSRKFRKIILAFSCLIFAFQAKAQVWFPEGEYYMPQPVAFTIDNNQIFTISKYTEDTTKSYWVVGKYDGKSWSNFPALVLNKTAEINTIKLYGSQLYIGGNFTYDNGAYNSLIKFNGTNWGPISKFKRNNQQNAVVTTLEIFNKKLIIGGNFNSVLATKDSVPYLVAFNGLTFSPVFNCNNCMPNGPVIDLAVTDTLLAIAGTFTSIKGKRSNYLFVHHLSDAFDTFINTPVIIDHLAMKGHTVFGTGILNKERKIYRVENGFTDLKFNFDSILKVNKLEIFENELWVNGIAFLKGSKIPRSTLEFNSATLLWEDKSINYPGAKSITVGRNALFAIGTATKPLSVWNKNIHVVRFYKNAVLTTVKVFLDSNNNCIQDKNERVLPKQFIKMSTPLNRYAITNEAGMAEFLFVPINAKIPFIINLPRNFKPSNCSFDTVFKSYNKNYIDSVKFPITRKSNINDVKVIISAPKGSQVMKDKRTEYFVTCENVGSNIVSGLVKLKKNPLLASSVTDPKPEASSTLETVVWSYVNLKPGEKRSFFFSGIAYDTSFKDNAPLQAQASASIAAASNDYPNDDSDSIEQYIDNKYAPFRKDIYPAPNPGDSVSYLTMNNRDIRYNISFNNYSSNMVYNAIITDTLDLNLDISYIEETGSNKAYYTKLESDPNNPSRGIIIWHFPNINLVANPTMDFENPNSGSYIGFKVVMKPISNGYIVKNTAAVFYDNQYVGKTNTAYCTVVNTSLHSVHTYNSFDLYPNPANDQLNLNLTLNSNDKVSIYNLQGQVVYEMLVNESTSMLTLPIESLSNGLYVVQIQKGSTLLHSKFIKQ